MQNQSENLEFEIDLLHILKLLLRKSWLIILAALVCAGALLSYAVFAVAPSYEAYAMMYVNNTSSNDSSISNSDLSAAKSLLDIYVVILKSQTTLEEVIQQAGLDCSVRELSNRVSANSVNGTEIFRITAVGSNPKEAKLIVDTILDVLPERISSIVDGSSVRIVDTADLPTSRSSPSYAKYTLVGFLLGIAITCIPIIVIDLMDTTIRSTEYLYQKYDIPILAVIPDASGSSKNTYYRPYGYETKKEQQDS